MIMVNEDVVVMVGNGGASAEKVEVEGKKIEGVEGWMRRDGKIWRLYTIGDGVVYAPWREEELGVAMWGSRGWTKGEEKKLVVHPTEEWRVPAAVLEQWTAAVSGEGTEVEVVVGRKRGTGEWLGVIPTQTVSSTSVEVEDIGPAVETLARMGGRFVGTFHIHPGVGATPSSTDTRENYSKIGGIHWIAGTPQGVDRVVDVTATLSAGGLVWGLEGWYGKITVPVEVGEGIPLWLEDGSPYSRSGMRALLKRPAAVIPTWQGQKGSGTLWGLPHYTEKGWKKVGEKEEWDWDAKEVLDGLPDQFDGGVNQVVECCLGKAGLEMWEMEDSVLREVKRLTRAMEKVDRALDKAIGASERLVREADKREEVAYADLQYYIKQVRDVLGILRDGRWFVE